jgi:HEAT repeat protein/ATP/ADP translocase
VTRLAATIGVRAGEGRLLVLVAGAFAAIEAGRGLGEVAVDTLVLSRAGPELLPPLFIGLGLVGLVSTLAYGTALARARSERFFPALLGVLAMVLAVLWVVALSGADAAYPVLWICVYLAGMLLLTAMWTVAATVFHARQAKRLFPLCTSAAIVGSFAGQLTAGPAALAVGTENLVLAEAALIVAAAALILALGQRLRPGRSEGPPSVSEALRTGAGYVVRSPLMRLVAVAYLLFAVLLFSVSFPFLRAMSEAFPDEGELATALGLFSAAVTAVSFVVAVLVANRLYAWLGIGTVALGLPLVYLLGFGLWMVRFTLATALAVRFAQQVMQRGVSNAAWSAFFTVVPAGRRGPVLAFIDGVPGQLGTALSGVLLLMAASLAAEQVYVVGAVTAAVATVVVLGIRRAYPASIVRTLRESPAERVLEGGPDLVALGRDARVVAELRAVAGSGSASDRRLAADLLGRIGAREAAPELHRLATDADPRVRLAALGSLKAMRDDGSSPPRPGARRTAGGRPDSLPAVVPESIMAKVLEDEDADVRAAGVALFAMEALADPDLAALVLRLADDPDAEVRAELAVALADREPAARGLELVGRLLDGETPRERAAGLRALRRIGSPAAGLLSQRLLADDHPSVRAAAITALAATSGASADPAPFLAALDDEAAEVRAASSSALRDMPAAARPLVASLDGASGRTALGVLAALDGHARTVREPLVAWAARQVTRATELRRASSLLQAFAQQPGMGGQVLTPHSAAPLLRQVLRDRERGVETLLLSALGILGAPEATGLIRRCLRSPDPETRAQAVEALDSLGDGRLARAVVRLLDSDDEMAALDPASAGDAATTQIRRLAEDADPWVRALALRTLSEQPGADGRGVLEQMRKDSDPVVRAFGPPEEEGDADVRDGPGRSDGLERMLILRRVPLFEALAPEDLQRVSASASERAWLGGEALMREGELGNELIVIVEGSVRVTRREGESERLLRSYGPGDHIGELAVLRERPRAATVVAEDPGVRGLVIGGAALQSILRERPDAAMAMLATLAERITRQ